MGIETKPVKRSEVIEYISNLDQYYADQGEVSCRLVIWENSDPNIISRKVNMKSTLSTILLLAETHRLFLYRNRIGNAKNCYELPSV